MEYFNEWPKNDEPYFRPVVSNPMANMSTKVLLNSTSNYTSIDKLEGNSLINFLSSLVKTGDREAIISIEAQKPEDKIELIIHSLFSSQFWFTRNITKEKIGLLYAQYHEIPRIHKEKLKVQYGDKYLHIPDIIAHDIGISLDRYLLASVFLLYIHYKDIYNNYLEPIDYVKNQFELLKHNEEDYTQLSQELVYEILMNATNFYHLLTFSKKPSLLTKYSLIQLIGYLSDEELDAYLKLTSKTINELREINKQPWYQKGHISQRLSPFERFPILKLDMPCYIIPNLRFFEVGITELIRFELQQLYQDNKFHQMMGAIQELLLVDLLTQLESPDFIIIEERTYYKNKSEYKGPDIIIIENGRPILIESKAKQILLETRLNLSHKILDKNIEPAVSAIVKLNEEKYQDLYEHDVYNDVQVNLNQKSEVVPLFIEIMAEGPIAFQEQVRRLRNKEQGHPLNNIEYPAIFIDVFNFYRAIEMSKSNGISLYDILEKYWKTGSNLEPKQSASDDFEGLRYDLGNSYSKLRFEHMIRGIFG